MGNHWIAETAFTMKSFWKDLIENNATVQFIHRTMGWLILIITTVVLFLGKSVTNKVQKNSLRYLLAMVFIQFVLGVLTLVYLVPLSIASMHQAGAVILLVLTLRALHNFAPKESSFA
jgi:cytochrome c oxidase assembly protein subunit 15